MTWRDVLQAVPETCNTVDLVLKLPGLSPCFLQGPGTGFA